MTTLLVPRRGLRGPTAYVLEDTETSSPGPARLELGWPEGLGVLYARYPLVTLLGLVGLGWLGGYLTWVFIGRRRR